MQNTIEEFLPIWKELRTKEQREISEAVICKTIEKGSTIHNGSLDCQGLILVKEGQLRAYIFSEKGKEITLYRLFQGELCLFSATCMLDNIQFDITISAEKDSELWVIPPKIFKKIMEESAPLANYTNKIMASRFSEVMWLMEQILWKNFDQRLAAFLLEEIKLENSTHLKITHEKIAYHLGTAREVVTRMLRYFQKENIVKLSRGSIKILDKEKLDNIKNT